MNLKEAYRNYLEFVAEKEVCIIGGADYDEAEIPESSLVVRTNNHWLRQKGRVDILYHSCSPNASPEELYKHPAFCRSIRYVLGFSWASAFSKLATASLYKGGTLIAIGDDQDNPFDAFYVRLFRILGEKPPFIGAVALYHLLQFPVARVYLLGMDFYQTGKAPAPEALQAHGLKQHAMLFLELERIDPRVELCPQLRQAALDELVDSQSLQLAL